MGLRGHGFASGLLSDSALLPATKRSGCRWSGSACYLKPVLILFNSLGGAKVRWRLSTAPLLGRTSLSSGLVAVQGREPALEKESVPSSTNIVRCTSYNMQARWRAHERTRERTAHSHFLSWQRRRRIQRRPHLAIATGTRSGEWSGVLVERVEWRPSMSKHSANEKSKEGNKRSAAELSLGEDPEEVGW